jgi:serine/threonine protein phosphatase PrpC
VAPVGVIDCFGMSDIGKVRERNEDQFLIADLMKSASILHSLSSPGDDTEVQGRSNANLLLVADGVGGNAGGERASRLAMEGVVEYLHNRRTWLLSVESRDEQICEELKSALAWAQQRIETEAELSPELARMGTTLTLAYLDWPTAYIAHVGDSRAYIFGQQELLQLTHDQTVAQMLADAGAIEADQVERHAFRNMLGSLLCCEPQQLSPCVYQRQLMPGDQLLLCTDGLTKLVSASQIAGILDSTYSAAEACRELIDAANAAGGTDNITAVLARFGHRLVDTVEDPAFGIEARTMVQLRQAMACSA